jgi:hypothetical protein
MTATGYDFLNASLVRGAAFSEKYEFPVIYSCNEIPNDLIPFSRARKSRDTKSFICFYERDREFENVWTHPRDYISMFRRFGGIIGFDFSLYRDMPLADQIFNTMRGRKLCYFYQKNGVKVIPNVRLGSEETSKFYLDGLPENSVLAVGTHGQTKNREDLGFIIKCLSGAVERLKPSLIIVYGSAPADITGLLDYHKIPYRVFKSYTGRVFARRKMTPVKGPLLPWEEKNVKEGA